MITVIKEGEELLTVRISTMINYKQPVCIFQFMFVQDMPSNKILPFNRTIDWKTKFVFVVVLIKNYFNIFI